MDEVARSVVARHLDGEVRATEPAPTGNSKRTVFATLADGREVVVQHAPGDELITETALWRAVADRTSVPVADILAVGEATHPKTGERLSYVVCEPVEGLDLHTVFTGLTPSDRHAVVRTLGAYLGELHDAFPFEGYGEVVDTDAGLRVAGPTSEPRNWTPPNRDWRAWFGSYLQAGLAGLGPELADLVPEIVATVDLATLPERPPATLFPWDFRPGNAILDEQTNKPAALLDWGAPLAADPALSLAKVEYLTADWYALESDTGTETESDTGTDTGTETDTETATRLREAFREGYAEYRPVPEVPRAYRLAAVVRSAYDSRGAVTRPGYPEREGESAVAFHREHLRRALRGIGAVASDSEGKTDI